MLTQKQKDLLMFIHQRISEKGVSPSFEEMKEALNLKSKSGIHRLITALEERGFIKRLAHRARALEIVKLPDSVVPDAIAEPDSGHIAAFKDAGTSVPLMGRIAAGVPLAPFRKKATQLLCLLKWLRKVSILRSKSMAIR